MPEKAKLNPISVETNRVIESSQITTSVMPDILTKEPTQKEKEDKEIREKLSRKQW